MSIDQEDKDVQNNKCNNDCWKQKLSFMTLVVLFQQIENFYNKLHIESIELENVRLIEN
jgi:hypothetical protein